MTPLGDFSYARLKDTHLQMMVEPRYDPYDGVTYTPVKWHGKQMYRHAELEGVHDLFPGIKWKMD